MKKLACSIIAAGLATVTVPAQAEVSSATGSASDEALACNKAKLDGRRLYNNSVWEVTGFGPCHCSARNTSHGMKEYTCSVDVRYRRRR